MMDATRQAGNDARGPEREAGDDDIPQDHKPVASLIEGYRTMRNEWLAQADMLARMRDEVRGAADRETLEIVTRARENIRNVISTARRELLTLTEQLRASLGDSEPDLRAMDLLPENADAVDFQKDSPGALPVADASEADELDRPEEHDERWADFQSLISESELGTHPSRP